MTEKKTHGGARPGSGRKATGRVASNPLLVYLDDEEKRKLDDALRKTGERKTTFVREAIRERIVNTRRRNGLPPL